MSKPNQTEAQSSKELPKTQTPVEQEQKQPEVPEGYVLRYTTPLGSLVMDRKA